MYQYHIQQLFHCLQSQSEQLNRMEQMLKEMRNDINQLQQGNQKPTDHVEYKFDLLKIEKLEGTLNIGVTPSDGKSLGDITVNGQPAEQIQAGAAGRNLYSNIYQQVSSHLEHAVPAQLEQMNPQSNHELGDQYAAVMIEDIRKQLEDRINVYLQQYQTNSASMNPGDVEQTIANQMKKEIDTAVEQHLHHLQQGKRNTNENDGHQ
ncbi:spore gernimation protein GerC [Paenibacillus sp. JNUCC32]|uniref:spore germination protein GerPC n=1 Tax=Paenibacillus sp. JNUCC32 TaxID=2777984 RepID=UPI0017888130|nr:spore germination protein GerPC [Paenibacillus sp. JNUCC-32]QOT12859.1 spore gernimation protein GerC [Paenibacillus sp. JNUCC-32]